MADQLHLRGLTVDTIIGVYPWEKTVPQRLLFDLTLPTDARKGAQDDALDDALDYVALADSLRAFCQANPVQLLETLAERMCTHLLAHFDLPWLELTVHKPGALEGCADIALSLRRTRTSGLS